MTKRSPRNTNEVNMIGRLLIMIIFLVVTSSQVSCQSATNGPNIRDTIINTSIFFLKTIDKGRHDSLDMMVWENRADSNEFIVKRFVRDKTTGFTHYKNRKAEGYFFHGYENGAIMQEGTYKKGKLDGVTIGYNEDGSPAIICNMKDDKIINVKYFDRKQKQ